MGRRGAAMSLLRKIGCAGVRIGVASSILSSSIYIVRSGEGAVVVDRFRGVMVEAVEDGAHLLIPWLQKSFISDIRMRPHTLSSVFLTKDFEQIVPVALFGLGCKTVDNSSFTVGLGESAVIFDIFQGTLKEPVCEGRHFYIPFFQTPTIIDVRSKPYEFTVECQTKHLQKLRIDIQTLSHPQVSTLPNLMKRLGVNYREVLLPIVVSRLASAHISGLDAEELTAKMAVLSSIIRKELEVEAEEYGVVLDDFTIASMSFLPTLNTVDLAQIDAKQAEYHCLLQKMKPKKK